MSNKIKILISTIVLGFILFASIVYLEKKAINYSPKVTVWRSTKVVEIGQEIKEIESYEIPLGEVTGDMIKNKEELTDKIAIEKIYSNEPINKNRIADKNSSAIFLSEPETRKFSIPMSFIDDPFSLSARKGDIVDIIHTTLPTNSMSDVKSSVVVQKARVIGAIDSDGNLIKESNRKLATAILFEGSPADAVRLTNGQYTGKYKFLINPPNSVTYGDITVTGTK